MPNTARELAEGLLGKTAERLWLRDLEFCRLSRWRQSNYISGVAVAVAETDSGTYVVTESVSTFERFVHECKVDLSDVPTALDLIRDVIPGTRRILFEDPDGLIRDLYGNDWDDPKYEDNNLIFFCDHAERGIIERWTVSTDRVVVDDVGEGYFALNM